MGGEVAGGKGGSGSSSGGSSSSGGVEGMREVAAIKREEERKGKGGELRPRLRVLPKLSKKHTNPRSFNQTGSYKVSILNRWATIKCQY